MRKVRVQRKEPKSDLTPSSVKKAWSDWLKQPGVKEKLQGAGLKVEDTLGGIKVSGAKPRKTDLDSAVRAPRGGNIFAVPAFKEAKQALAAKPEHAGLRMIRPQWFRKPPVGQKLLPAPAGSPPRDPAGSELSSRLNKPAARRPAESVRGYFRRRGLDIQGPRINPPRYGKGQRTTFLAPPDEALPAKDVIVRRQLAAASTASRARRGGWAPDRGRKSHVTEGPLIRKKAPQIPEPTKSSTWMQYLARKHATLMQDVPRRVALAVPPKAAGPFEMGPRRIIPRSQMTALPKSVKIGAGLIGLAGAAAVGAELYKAHRERKAALQQVNTYRAKKGLRPRRYHQI